MEYPKKLHLFFFRTKRYWINIYYFICGLFIKSNYKEIDNHKHLIICAHPDDETVFFSSIIKEHKPFVVCMSNRGNPTQVKEFRNALSYWGIKGCMLNMPDVPKHFNRAWKSRMIFSFLRKILKNCQNLECLYTHNTAGESEHAHHQSLGAAVIQVFSDYPIFMTARTLEDPDTLNNEMYIEKQTILTTIYPSQYKWLKTSCGWFNRYLSQEKFEEVR